MVFNDSKPNLIGKKYRGETVIDYSNDGIIVTDSFGRVKEIKDSEVYSLYDLFHTDDCAAWVIIPSDNPNVAVYTPANQLGFLEEDEESMSDSIVLKDKVPTDDTNTMFIYVGVSNDGLTEKDFELSGEDIMPVDTAIKLAVNEYNKMFDKARARDSKCNDEYECFQYQLYIVNRGKTEIISKKYSTETYCLLDAIKDAQHEMTDLRSGEVQIRLFIDGEYEDSYSIEDAIDRVRFIRKYGERYAE